MLQPLHARPGPGVGTAPVRHPVAAAPALPLPAPPLPAPPLPAPPRADRADIDGIQRSLLVAAVLALHGVAAWALLQVDAVRESLAQAMPTFVEVWAPAPPLPEPRLPRLPSLPPVPAVQKRVEPRPSAKPPLPVLAAAPDMGPATFSVPLPPESLSTPPSVAATPVVAVAAPAPAAPPPLPKEIPASAVQYIDPPAAVYPRQSRRHGEAGRVIVRVYVDAAGGAPRSVQVSQSSGHARLDEAALLAVQKARFKSHTSNGVAVEGWALIPIDFQLEQ